MAHETASGPAGALVTAGVPVRLERLSKRFGPVVAVDEVSLQFPAGSLATLLGPSGCGKTTTLRMVAGLEVPTGGRILIGEEDVTPLPAASRGVTMVFQSYALFPHLTVFENVA
ncbi:MAG: ATP-binding cassette domain-containing protein, partial [Gemmatimonadales bacterium]